MNIFKAYRKGKSAKVPQNKVKYSYDEVQDCENYGAICNDDIVDVSFDDIEMFDKFLDLCDDMSLTPYALYSPHGGHTFWRYNDNIINGKDIQTAGGFTVDIHNKGTYIPLKCDGRLRKEVYDNAEIYDLPIFLYPIKSNEKLWQLKDGDGRNDILSKHAFILNNQLQLEKDEIINQINLINKYILKDQIPQDELDTILRDETFDKMQKNVFFDGHSFLHHVFGEYLINKYHIVMIDRQLHMFNGEIYEHVEGDDNILNAMITEIENLKDAQRTEVIKYIKIRAIKCEAASERYIAFKNGIYDIYEETLLPFSTELYVTIQIPWNYNNKAYHKLTDTVLDNISCQDTEVRALLEECIGYCFYKTNELGSSFFLIGNRSNGKSTFLKMVKNVLGRKNYSALDLSELSERFNTATMYNKLANIGDDIGDEYLYGSKVAIFKKLVTGDTVKAEEKNQPVFMFDPFAKMFFAANEMPKIKDKTGAVLRRMVIVPFNAEFNRDDPNFKHNIIKDLITAEAAEYLINIGIKGLNRILDRQNFTQPDKVKKQLEEYERSNDTVLQFVEEVGLEEIIGNSVDDVYARYQVYCAKNGYQYTGVKNTFSASLKKKYNIEARQVRILGKRINTYIKT